MKGRSPAQLIKLVVGLLIAVFFASRAFGKMDWAGAGKAIAEADRMWILIGILSLAADYTLRTLRWWLMLRTLRPGLPASACAGPFLGSIALNNVLPFRAGDVFRIFGFRDKLGVPPAEVTGTMVVERLMDLVSLMLVFAVGLAGAKPGAVPPGFVTGAIAAAAVGFFGLVFLLAAPDRALALAGGIAAKKPGTFAGKLAGAAQGFFLPIARLRSPKLLVGLFVMSIAAWVLEGGLFLATARALGLDQPGLGHFAMSTSTLATLVPSTPGYVGVFDYGVVLGATAYGVKEGPAGVYALLVHVLLWLPLTLAGFLALALSGGLSGLAAAKRGSVLATDHD